jgi:hypothetical protein
VGESGKMGQRLATHVRSGRAKSLGDIRVTAVSGGRRARQIAEQNRINELGGVSGRAGSKTSNVRNPVAPKYWDEFGIKPPMRWKGSSIRP